MLQGWVVVSLALVYICFLFVIASVGDRLGLRQIHRSSWRFLYPLSLAVYCTSWTFFGSVGLAAHTGLGFLSIYIGPILMIGLGWPLLLRIIRLAKAQNITSIADFIAARYGKSHSVAALVTLVAIAGSLPYTALQLKAASASLSTILERPEAFSAHPASWLSNIALFVAVSMALFAILFGTRHTDASEHQQGLMLAIATESIVKLVAFLVVGTFVIFIQFDGPLDLYAQAAARPQSLVPLQPDSLGGVGLTMTLLSFFAFVLLPRQFHVAVVENNAPAEVKRAAWLFPLYLVLINIFVVPIAMAGLVTFPAGSVDSDMFVLALPLSAHAELITIIAFIGGLSAATAMVIVECVALSIMVSNGLVMPLLLHRRAAGNAATQRPEASDLTALPLVARRIAILAVLALAYIYYLGAGSAQLAQIGLLSFAGVAQLAPAFFGGLVWRRANARGAIAGLSIGTLTWAYTLLLPVFVDAGHIDPRILAEGPFGLDLLRPQALFGLELDPLSHGVVWSLALNVAALVIGSLTRAALPLERMQVETFFDAEPTMRGRGAWPWRGSTTIGELVATVARYLGEERARRSFESFAEQNNIALDPTRDVDVHLLRHAEFLLSSAIGAASSRLVLSLLLRKRTASTKAALKLLDNASAAFHHNREILQSALDHVRQGIAVFDAQSRLICWNRQFGEILELPADRVRLGAGLPELLRFATTFSGLGAGEPGDFVASRVRRYAERLETGRERMARTGTVIEVRTNRMPDGGIVMTFTDVTESVRAEESLERANETLEGRVRQRTAELTRLNLELERAKSAAEEADRSKTRFLAAASHDVLQPLHAARLYVTALVERETDAEIGRLATNVDSSLEAVEEILGALLEISRLDSGKMNPELGTVAVSELFSQLETEFAPLAAERGLKLTFMPSSLAVRSDRRLLRRLVQNLVSNAIKYTPSGRVLVGARRRRNRVRFEVYDTGLGIPPAQQTLIFKEFQRLDQGARMARGLGLGLSIVERLSRVLKHRIRVRSVPGQGSVFTVEVPLVASVPEAKPVAPNAPAPIHAPLAGLSVLVLDNDATILDGMVALLSNWGCKIATAATLEDATATLRDTMPAPDVLLIDYHLDEGNGLDAAKVLRWRLGARDAGGADHRRSQPRRCARRPPTFRCSCSTSRSMRRRYALCWRAGGRRGTSRPSDCAPVDQRAS